MSDATESTSATTQPRRRVLSLLILLALALAVLALGGVLVTRSGGIHLRLPSLLPKSSKSSPTAAPKAAIVASPTLDLPTPEPTKTATPIPVLPSVQLVVDGRGEYIGMYPYLAEYTLTLARGEAVSVTVSCTGCLWPSTGTPMLGLATGAGSKKTIQALVLPMSKVHFIVALNGVECQSWDLQPTGQERSFRGICTAS